MTNEIDIGTVAKAYARWAPVYDFVFGAVFDAGRKASIAAAERIGGRILDVGIGTGISLMDYSSDNRIVGVDYSEPMLRKAFEQGVAPVARRLGWRPEFRWERLARWAECHRGVRVIERRPMPPFGHFSLIRFARTAAMAPTGQTIDGRQMV